MSRIKQSFWSIYKKDADAIDAELAWSVARPNLEGLGKLESKYYFGDADKTLKTIDKQSQYHRNFFIYGDWIDVILGNLANLEYRRIFVGQHESFPIDWNKWAIPYSKPTSFTMAFYYNIHYSYWQNTDDIESYKEESKPYNHLKVIPSGDTPPYPEYKLDISDNVGRSIPRIGYSERVCATMWLGDRFFKLTGANKEAVMAAEWLKVETIHPHVIKIQAQEEPFTSDQGKERELQIALRELLYPNHREQA